MEDNFQIELNRIREEANLGFEKIQKHFHQKLEAIRTSSVAERINRNREIDCIRDNALREINKIPEQAAYHAIGISVGGVDFCFGTGITLILNGLPQNIPINVGYYAAPLLLYADGISRWVGLATENKDLALYGIITPVVKGIRKLGSYLRRR